MKIAGSCAFSSRSRVRGGAGPLFPSDRHRLARSGTPPCCLPCPSFAAHPPWADRRPAVAAQFPPSAAQENGDIMHRFARLCTQIGCAAYKTPRKIGLNRSNCAISFAVFPSKNRQLRLSKRPTFAQKSPCLGPFRGIATRSARSLHFEIDTKRLLLQRKYKIRPLIHVFFPRHSQSHTQGIGRRAVPFCGLRRHCARAPARGSRPLHGPFLGRCGHPSFSSRH